MANMNVTYSDMTDAAKRLDTGKADIISKLNELKALVGQLVGSGFVTDAASGAFNTSYEQFDKGTQQAVNGLDGMSQFLNKAAGAMQNVDDELAMGIGG
jgi:WXG100 family type VII secretion target